MWLFQIFLLLASQAPTIHRSSIHSAYGHQSIYQFICIRSQRSI